MDHALLYRHYGAHIAIQQQRVRGALVCLGLDYLVIHSGQPHRQFLDDQDYPFKANPHFKAWLPLTDSPNCWLIVNGDDKPKLLFFQPQDYWHAAPQLPPPEVSDHFAIQVLTRADDAAHWLPPLAQAAYIGEAVELARVLGFSRINPDEVLHQLHYLRAYKSDYEIDCMTAASALAVAGHRAAATAFAAGASEYEIHLAYLAATGHAETELPYGNIIGLNQHAAVLHYTALERQRQSLRLSFLIDAGASCNGYAADITRTYAAAAGPFAELIVAMDQLQQQLVAGVVPGARFADLHQQCHRGIARVLVDHGLATGSVEALVEQRVTHAFFPHGLGHLIGLQVHDVGGHLADERGTPAPPPADHPYLRLTRTLEPRMVVTIEPGLYFIDELLKSLAAAPGGKLVNWHAVDQLRPCGGIRIEDDVLLLRERTVNLTRDQGLAQPAVVT